jgi:protein-tyrosine-phosphatase
MAETIAKHLFPLCDWFSGGLNVNHTEPGNTINPFAARALETLNIPGGDDFRSTSAVRRLTERKYDYLVVINDKKDYRKYLSDLIDNDRYRLWSLGDPYKKSEAECPEGERYKHYLILAEVLVVEIRRFASSI